jgi:hypothetical protein
MNQEHGMPQATMRMAKM